MVYTAAGQLKLLVLKLLSEKPMSGYSLIHAIHDHTGFWHPSPGSMYPLLNSLERKGFLKATRDGKKKIYSLTKDGQALLQTLDKHKKVVMSHILKNMEVFESLVGKNEADKLKKIFNDIKSDSLPFKELYPEALELKLELFKLGQSKAIKEKSIQIKKILRETTQKLKKLRTEKSARLSKGKNDSAT